MVVGGGDSFISRVARPTVSPSHHIHTHPLLFTPSRLPPSPSTPCSHSQDEVTADLACGKCFIQGTGPGRAAAGHPLLVVLVARHSKAASGADAGAATKRFVCWCLDVAAAACDPATNPAGAVCGLFDFRGVSMDCLDIPALKAIFAMLQAHFPERLDRLVMFAAPSIFLGLWRVLTPFLDAKTRGKVCFVQAGEDVGAALPHVAAAALPAAYGGQAELVSITCAAEQVGMMGAAAAVPPPSPAAPPAPDARPPSGASAAAPRDGDGALTDDGSELEAAVEAELAKAGGGGAGEAAGGGGGLVAAAMVS